MTEISTNNVILFPGVKSVFEPAPPSLEAIRANNVNLIVEQVNDLYLTLLKKYDIRVSTTPNFLKDTSFIKEAVRSGACRASRLPHAFQQMADNMFEVTESDDSFELNQVAVALVRVQEEDINEVS